jgi:hypothetical protein
MDGCFVRNKKKNPGQHNRPAGPAAGAAQKYVKILPDVSRPRLHTIAGEALRADLRCFVHVAQTWLKDGPGSFQGRIRTKAGFKTPHKYRVLEVSTYRPCGPLLPRITAEAFGGCSLQLLDVLIPTSY